jgi:uncharacterized protein YndB with AHSA1/START domain
MTDDTMTASLAIDAPADAVFSVLADPSTHAAIDGTGWVREALDGDRLGREGQIFRVAMFHPNHPDGHYEMANRVVAFEPARTIAWEPGQRDADSFELSFGGWIWRYDLTSAEPSRTEVTLTYDWSAVPPSVREYIAFPPFGKDHLERSLRNLAALSG